MKPSKRSYSDVEQQFAEKEMKRYKELTEEDSQNKEAYSGVETYAIQLGLYGEAIEIFERAIKSNPKDDFYYIKLGNIYYNAGKDDKAILTYEMALRLNKSNTFFHEILSNLYMRHGLYQKALLAFPNDAELYESIYQVALKQENCSEEILKVFCSSLEVRFNNEKVYHYVFSLCKKLPKSCELASNTFRWVIAHNVDYKPAYKALYDLAVLTNIYKPTMEEFYKTLKVMPSHEEAHNYLKMILYRSQDYSTAVSMFRSLIAIAPRVKPFYITLTKSYWAMNKKDAAIATLKKALHYCGDDDEIHALMVWLYMEKGQYKYALKLVDQARSKVSEPRELYQMQYQIYLKLNQNKRAISFYKEVMEVFPEDKSQYEDVFETSCEIGFYNDALDVAPQQQVLFEAVLALAQMDPDFTNILSLYERALMVFPKKESLLQAMTAQCLEEGKTKEAFALIKIFLNEEACDIAQNQRALDLAIELEQDDEAMYFYKRLCFLGVSPKSDIYDICLRTKSFVMAVDVCPPSLGHYSQLYQHCLSEHEEWSAVFVLEKMLDVFPEDVETMTTLLQHYQQFSEYAKGIQLCEDKEGQFSKASQFLAWAELEHCMKHTDKALDILEKTMLIFPNDLEIYVRFASLSLELRPLDQTIKHCLKASTKFPQENIFLKWLGDVYWKKGDFLEAIDAYFKAILLDPFQLEVYQKLIEIGKKSSQDDRIIDVCHRGIENFSEEIMFYVELGDLYRKQLEYSKAIEVFRDALKVSPGNKMCYQNLFSIYCDMGDYKNALRLSPEERDSFLLLYEEANEHDQGDVVIEILKKAVRILPQDFELHEKLAAALYRDGQLGNAETIFKKMLGLDPKHLQTYTHLFHLRCQMKHYEEAIAIYVEAAHKWPQEEMIFAKLASVYYWMKDFPMAADSYEKQLRLNNHRKSVYQKLAVIYEKLNQMTDAIHIYKAAIAQFPYEIELYKQRARLLEFLEDFGEAVRVLQTAIRQNDRDIPLYVQLGLIYKKVGRYKESVACFEDAIRLDTNNEQRYVDLGEIYVHFEKEVEALDLFKGIVRRWPTNTMAYKYLFEIYESRQKFDYAEEYFRDLIEQEERSNDDPNALPYRYLFNLYYRQKKFLEAIDLLETSLSRFFSSTDFLNRLGALYYKLGKSSEAIVYYQKSLKVNSEDQKVYKFLFNIYFKAGRLKEAMLVYKQALQKWPNLKEEFAILYKLCSTIESDEDAYKQIEVVLEDVHNEYQYSLL